MAYKGVTICSAILTPLGPARPCHCQRGQLYCAAQVKYRDLFGVVSPLAEEGQVQFSLVLPTVRGGAHSVQPYSLGL